MFKTYRACTWQLPWLAVECAWSALAAPLSPH